MQKFRHKSADVEAVRYSEPEDLHGPNHPKHPLPDGCEWRQFGSTWKPVATSREFSSFYGITAAEPGDWLVKDSLGLCVMTDADFQAAFDPVVSEPPPKVPVVKPEQPTVAKPDAKPALTPTQK